LKQFKKKFKLFKKFKRVLIKFRQRKHKFYKKNKYFNFFTRKNFFNKKDYILDKKSKIFYQLLRRKKFKNKIKMRKLKKIKKLLLKKFIFTNFKNNKSKNILYFLKIMNKKFFYISTILNKKYLNFILLSTCNKFIFFKKFQLILFNNLYFFKIFSIFSFLFKLNFFFKNILIKKYEFFFYYKNIMLFDEMLENLNEFSLILKKNKFNFIYIYKFIFEKILVIELYLKQFFFILIKIKKNCFKYKYFFFNIIKYLIILKKKYLYLTTLDLFFKIINKKFLLSEKFNTKLMTLCTLKKKCMLNLKKKIKHKYNVFLMKKKTKKYFGYILRNIRKHKKKKSIFIK